MARCDTRVKILQVGRKSRVELVGDGSQVLASAEIEGVQGSGKWTGRCTACGWTRNMEYAKETRVAAGEHLLDHHCSGNGTSPTTRIPTRVAVVSTETFGHRTDALRSLRAREEDLEDEVEELRGRERILETEVQKVRARESELQQELNRLRDREESLEGDLQQLQTREQQLEQEVKLLREQEAALGRQIDMLRIDEDRMVREIETLQERERRHGQQIQELQGENSILKGELSTLSERETGSEDDIRTLQGQVTQLMAQVTTLEQRERELKGDLEQSQSRIAELEEIEPSAQAPKWYNYIPDKNFNLLVNLAQKQLTGIQIHRDALRDAKRLNSSKDLNILREAWRALGSLHEYASTEHKFPGDYEGWTRSGTSKHAILINRVAMRETEVTMAKHGETRVFPVDPAVSVQERISMQAHLKVSLKGKDSVRIFFHDDTEGETGLVHVGFIGPHDLVPVASHK